MPSIEVSEERGVRYLHFGSELIQGAMRIARPWALELEYTRDMMIPLLLRADPDWPETVLQVGLGPGSHTKFLYRHRPRARITVVEMLPEVVAAARQFFKLPEDDARVRIEIGDGHDFLAASRRRFDLILVDGFDDKGRPGMLDTVPFYLNCRERLGRRGAMAVNLLTRRRGAQPSFERLREAFGERVLLMPPGEAGNAVAIAAAGAAIRESFTELRSAANRLKAQTGLDLHPAIARIASSGAARGEAIAL
ncbi:MAG TPA: fused MFS/spermidine synthase [Usitatibacter sp.]|nr:fused MFS/spermidine synthase [Usitatibacter sp.]